MYCDVYKNKLTKFTKNNATKYAWLKTPIARSTYKPKNVFCVITGPKYLII